MNPLVSLGARARPPPRANRLPRSAQRRIRRSRRRHRRRARSHRRDDPRRDDRPCPEPCPRSPSRPRWTRPPGGAGDAAIDAEIVLEAGAEPAALSTHWALRGPGTGDGDQWIVEGYGAIAVDVARGLDIRLETPVAVSSTRREVTVVTEAERDHADRCVCTVPLSLSRGGRAGHPTRRFPIAIAKLLSPLGMGRGREGDPALRRPLVAPQPVGLNKMRLDDDEPSWVKRARWRSTPPAHPPSPASSLAERDPPPPTVARRMGKSPRSRPRRSPCGVVAGQATVMTAAPFTRSAARSCERVTRPLERVAPVRHDAEPQPSPRSRSSSWPSRPRFRSHPDVTVPLPGTARASQPSAGMSLRWMPAIGASVPPRSERGIATGTKSPTGVSRIAASRGSGRRGP